MSQYRYNIYGSMIETGDTPTVISNIFSPGRLLGCEFKVLGADLLGVGSGSCLLPDGVLLIEDAENKLIVPNSSSSVDYTVLYQLEDSRVLGGSPAILRIVSGILRQEDLADATILGWVRYSGSSAPLSDAMFIQPSSLRVVPQSKSLSFYSISPFTSAIRPTTEVAGSTNIISVPMANMQIGQTLYKSLGGVNSARVIGASINSDLGVTSSQSNYLIYTVKNSSTTLFSLDTRQTSLPIDTQAPMSKNTGALVSDFIFDVSQSADVAVQRVGNPSPMITGDISVGLSFTTFTRTSGYAYQFTSGDLLKYLFFRSGANTGAIAQIIEVVNTTQVKLKEMGQSFSSSTNDVVELQNFGEVVLTVESPASSGKWTERLLTVNNERVSRFDNIASSTELYLLQFPFIVSSSGQPRKLITRLLVDFSCIVTLRLRVQGQVITLSPAGGSVSNTGTLITSELDIPSTSSVSWNPGSTGVIEAEINAQSGRGASFAWLGLVQEPTPFKIFAV